MLHNVSLGKHVCIERGILFMIHEIYDPLYILRQVVERAKRIFQRACELNLGWDDELPEQLESLWNSWFEICVLGKTPGFHDVVFRIMRFVT